MNVDVYFNLHKKTFSVRAREGTKKGLVIAHMDSLILKDVTFHVSEAGRQRVLRERAKNIHAVTRGTLVETAPDTPNLVRYNPYEGPDFMSDGQPIKSAAYARLDNKKMFVS